jgi:hypothetical protein
MQARLAPAARERREKEQNPGKVTSVWGKGPTPMGSFLIKSEKPVWPELGFGLVALADVAALSSIMIQETGPACRLWELEAFAFRWWTTHGVEESPKSCEAVQSNP